MNLNIQHPTKSAGFRIAVWQPDRSLPGVSDYHAMRFRAELDFPVPFSNVRKFDECCRTAGRVWSSTVGHTRVARPSTEFYLLVARISSRRGSTYGSPVEQTAYGGIVVRENSDLSAGRIWDVVIVRGCHTSLEKTQRPISVVPRASGAVESSTNSRAHSYLVQEGAVLFLVAESGPWNQILKPYLRLANERIDIPFDTPYAMVGLEDSVVTEDSQRLAFVDYERDRKNVFA